MGRDFILLAFTVVIVGGMGSIWGAVVAGLLLTQVQALASLVISPVWTDPIVFGVMVLFSMFRPQGCSDASAMHDRLTLAMRASHVPDRDLRLP